MTSKQPEIYTVGHGDRSLDELTELLHAAGIESLVDVRAQPGSRRFPRFNADTLRAAVEQTGITYHWAGKQLGGRRTLAPRSVHSALGARGLQAFADYMDTELFHKSAAQLMALAGKHPLALLCAERLPQDCHRSLIADFVGLQGARVLHLINPGEIIAHQLTPAARARDPDRVGAGLIYDGGCGIALKPST